MAALAVIGPDRATLPLALVPYTLAFASLLLLHTRAPGVLDRGRILLGGALALRVLFLPTLPDLSDDLYRYVWDGLLTARGVNPFRFLPSDPELLTAGDPELLAAMNSPGYFSIYPPLSQLVFLVGGLVHELRGWPASAFAVKLVFTGMEFTGVVLLHRALRRLKLRPGALALYAWNPLVVVTLAGSGHSEGAFVLGAGLLVLGVAASRPILPWIGWALAVSSKGIPLLLAPLLFRHQSGRVGGRSTLFGATAGGLVLLALTLPFLFPGILGRALASAELYVRLFEFNAGPYFAAKALLLALTGEDWSKQLGPAFAGAFLLLALGVSWRWPVRERIDLLRGALLLFSLYLLFATTVHPWYLVWGLVLVPFTPLLRPVWLWASWAAFPTYLTYTGSSPAALAGLFWGGAAVALLFENRGKALDPLLRLAGLRKARGIRPHVQGARVLDLGGGEGYVGAALAIEGRTVRIAEVERFPGAVLPGVLYDGRRLPFADGTFDSVVLSLVLHHARNPDQLLEEALRVSRGRVVVTESLYRHEWERRLLEFLDRAANHGRGSGGMARDPEPIRFRTEEGWRAAFERAGARIEWTGRLNRVGHRHHLFVLSR